MSTREDLAAGLAELADLINFDVGAWHDLGYENPPDSKCDDCPHGRTAHLTRAPSRPEPYHCSACGCRQYRGPHYATIPPLGERSAAAIKAGHEAVKDIDQLIARLHRLREQLVGELRQDEDIRAARVDAMLADRRPDQRAAALAQRMSRKSGGAR